MIQRILGVFGLVFLSMLSLGAAPEQAQLRVEVTDLRNHQGALRVGVFNQPQGFPEKREAALFWKSLPAGQQPPTITIPLPPGRYAIIVLHDENSNERLDRNWLGIPKEGYGASNNPKPKRRAATFEEAAFDLPPEGKTLTISVQYNFN